MSSIFREAHAFNAWTPSRHCCEYFIQSHSRLFQCKIDSDGVVRMAVGYIHVGAPPPQGPPGDARQGATCWKPARSGGGVLQAIMYLTQLPAQAGEMHIPCFVRMEYASQYFVLVLTEYNLEDYT